MSLTAFFAFCILGCVFMLVVLFQWLYGEKRRERFKRSGTRKRTLPSQSPVYYVPAKGGSRRNLPASKLPAKPGPSLVTKSDAPGSSELGNERLAYQRIVASFARRRA
jgi:hypothetical protein